MEYRRLGRSGLHVSVAGLGCNNFGMRIDYEAAEKVTNAGARRGGHAVRHSGRVRTGRIGGDARAGAGGAASRGDHRDQVRGPHGRGSRCTGGGSRHRITDACEDSLRRLGTDYIDLYQMHMPDPETPIEETLHALDDLVRAGKVRYLGNSNYKGWQIAEAHWTAEKHHLTKFVSAQNHYNLMERGVETEVVPAANRYGLGILPYFPLASGFLTGKYRPGQAAAEGTRLAAWGRADAVLTEENFAKLEKLEAWSDERGHRARAGRRVAGVAVARGQRDLGRDEAGAARRERGGGRVDADGGGSRGGRGDRGVGRYRRAVSLSRYRSMSAASAFPRIPEQ